MASRAPIDVFRFRDYRAFLRAYYAQRKELKDGFSLRAFSRRVGLRSPNYLKLVMDGDRNLTPEMAARFAEACGLGGEPLDYFCDLVSFNQAKTSRERERAYDRLRAFRRYRKTHRLDAAHAAYHSEWFIPAVRELVLRPDFREEARWVGRTLLPAISSKQAQRALDVLLQLGLLERDAEGQLRQAEPLLQTADGPLSHHVASYHRSMLGHAAEALDRVPRDDREISSLTLCLSQARMGELKAHLERLRRELLETYGADPDGERVVQLNFQMFPLSEKREEP